MHILLTKRSQILKIFNKKILYQAQFGAFSKQILSILRLNHDEENPLFKTWDIYNVWQKIRKQNLE